MTKYAVIQTGGKQYRVSEGDEIFIEKLEGEPDDEVEFTDVLVISDGETFRSGTPYLEDAVVRGKIVKQGRGKKITVFKYKSKKHYRRKMGHRQPYTRVRIEAIEG